MQQHMPSQRVAGRSAAPTAVCVGLVLALGWQPANAATMGSVATSLGFFVALAALLVSQALPAQLAPEALPMLGVALLLSAAAVVLWGLRRAPFAAGLRSLAPRAVRVPAQPVVPVAEIALPAGFEHDTLLADLRRQFITLHAKLLGFDEVGSAYLASVEFSGIIRECDEAGAAPFRELWMLARPKHDAEGWRLARQLDLP